MNKRNWLDAIASKEKFVLIFFMIITNLFFLIHNGVYIDDWYNQLIGPGAYLRHNLECGRPWFGYAVLPVFPLPDIFTNSIIYLHRLVIFLCYLFVGLFFHSLLKKITEINQFERLILSLLFVIIPYFESRIFVSMWLYPFCYFIFYMALYLSAFRKKIIVRIITLVLFAFSFLVQSLIFFYALVFIFFIYQEKDKLFAAIKSSKRIKKTVLFILNVIKEQIDFFLLPIVVWTVQRALFPPYGDYSNYNVITKKSILASPRFMAKTLFNTVIDLPYAMVLYIFKSNIFLLIFLAGILGILFLVFRKKYIAHSQEKSGIKKNIVFIVLGLTTFFLAIFPYAAVGKGAPSLFSWSNRNQLLMPLGVSLMSYYSLDLFFRLLGKKEKPVVYSLFYSLVLILLTNYSIISWSEYNVNWYKQLAIIENFKQEDLMRDNRIFLVDDKTYELNEIKQKGRSILFYEYIGMLESAFPHSIKFMEKESQFREMLLHEKYLTSYYLIGGFHYPNSNYNLEKLELERPFYLVTIQYGKKRVDTIYEIIQLKYLQLFHHDQFKQQIVDMVSINVMKLSDSDL